MKPLSKIPRSTLRKYCDSMWTQLTKHGKTHCEWCDKEIEKGKESRLLNAHHLITRQNLKFRWELNNVAILCPYCHKFSPKSVHTSTWIFYKWLKQANPDKYNWWVANCEDFPVGYEPNYVEIYKNLNEKYQEIYGIPFKKVVNLRE